MLLMCPVNKLGKVDILVVSHHGLFQSSSPASGGYDRAPHSHNEQWGQEGRLHANL